MKDSLWLNEFSNCYLEATITFCSFYFQKIFKSFCKNLFGRFYYTNVFRTSIFTQNVKKDHTQNFQCPECCLHRTKLGISRRTDYCHIFVLSTPWHRRCQPPEVGSSCSGTKTVVSAIGNVRSTGPHRGRWMYGAPPVFGEVSFFSVVWIPSG